MIFDEYNFSNWRMINIYLTAELAKQALTHAFWMKMWKRMNFHKSYLKMPISFAYSEMCSF